MTKNLCKDLASAFAMGLFWIALFGGLIILGTS